MFLELSADQDFLRETTARFLSKEVTVSDLRALRHDPDGFDRAYWRRGADLGWTSLLVDEQHGGGSVSGQGLVDLMLIAYEFGRHGAPGPLAVTNLVAAALSANPSDAHTHVLEGILAGTTVATWAFEEGPAAGFDHMGLEVSLESGEVVLDGRKSPVEAGAQAEYLLVTGRSSEGLTQVLVPAEAIGVSIRPMQSVDLTRRSAVVDFDSVRLPMSAVVGQPGQAATQVGRQLQQALVIVSAESVGVMDTAFRMTVEWAFDRYSFGRPLASYQALKHRFADMKMWLEGAHAVAHASACAVESGGPDALELASAAKAFVGQYGGEMLQDCVQLYGGIGLTYEHDLHIFLRRMTLDRMLYGTPADHRQRLATHALEMDN